MESSGVNIEHPVCIYGRPTRAWGPPWIEPADPPDSFCDGPEDDNEWEERTQPDTDEYDVASPADWPPRGEKPPKMWSEDGDSVYQDVLLHNRE
jgi:hypothetical protein